MNWRDAALAMAGLIGSFVAVVHGILVQRYMVQPIAELVAETRMAAATRRFVPTLLHFSTVGWFLGGLALIAAAFLFEPETRLATGWFVGGLFLYGAVIIVWASRARHPGWMLMAVALVLIVVGADASGR